MGPYKILEKKKRKERINQFLLGLDDEFGASRGQILSKKITPLLSKVLFLITQEENHKKKMRNSQIQEVNSSAMVNTNKKQPAKTNSKKEKKESEEKYICKTGKCLNTN